MLISLPMSLRSVIWNIRKRKEKYRQTRFSLCSRRRKGFSPSPLPLPFLWPTRRLNSFINDYGYKVACAREPRKTGKEPPEVSPDCWRLALRICNCLISLAIRIPQQSLWIVWRSSYDKRMSSFGSLALFLYPSLQPELDQLTQGLLA